jgi:hypothetical protein
MRSKAEFDQQFRAVQVLYFAMLASLAAICDRSGSGFHERLRAASSPQVSFLFS